MKIRKIDGAFGHERMTVRGFKYSDDAHKFLNRGANGLKWSEYLGALAAGVYAYVGGDWVNVKKIDPMVLPHV